MRSATDLPLIFAVDDLEKELTGWCEPVQGLVRAMRAHCGKEVLKQARRLFAITLTGLGTVLQKPSTDGASRLSMLV